ncbi:MAG: HAD family hydrolase [Infirmifilum sp.]
MKKISVVSFDLDGTLVTREYVDFFWLELVPKLYAEKHGLEIKEAKRKVYAYYDEVGPGDVRWYMPNYWFKRFGIEESLNYALTESAKMISPYSDAVEVVAELRKKYTLVLSTAAAREFVNLVFQSVPIYRESFKLVFSSSSDFGLPGKPPDFYRRILKALGKEPSEVVHVGDDEENDLKNAVSVGLTAVLVSRSLNQDLKTLLDGIL